MSLPRECLSALEAGLRPDLFKALGDPTRLSVVARLAVASAPLTVTDVSDCCGVHFSGVSRHLATLRQAGLVRSEKCGREVRYTLECGALAAALRGLANALDACRRACRPRPEETDS